MTRYTKAEIAAQLAAAIAELGDLDEPDDVFVARLQAGGRIDNPAWRLCRVLADAQRDLAVLNYLVYKHLTGPR